MSIVERELALLRHPRLAALATSAWPAWLWSADGARILWANAVGAAIFDAAAVSALTQRRFDVRNTVAAQIVRLAATLPSSAQERLERLRGFGEGFGRALTCACSRIVVADGNAAVLVAATEPAGPALTLDERVRRLFADGEEPAAAFTPDGKLIYANTTAQSLLAGATTLAALSLQTLAFTALETGNASGTARSGDTSFDVAALRLGADAALVLALILPRQPNPAARPQSAAPAVAAPPTLPPAARQEPQAERRHPLRFVWHMDADGRFGVGSDEFIELMGPRTTAAFGRLWNEVAAELKLDPNNAVARAVASHETWSGIVVSWPVDDSSERLPVEMSGLPVFDRDRGFRGYRGFGVCRDIERINQLARTRSERPIGFMAAPMAEPLPAETAAPPAAAPDKTPATPASEAVLPSERPAAEAAPASANVVPFRSSPPAEPKPAPALSPVERRAFRELAQELTARLQTPEQAATAEPTEEALPSEAAEPISPAAAGETASEHVLLDRIPLGVLIYRHDAPLYANRHFLEWSGYENLDSITAAGGLGTLFVEPAADALTETGGAQSLSIMTRRGNSVPVEGRMFTVPWNGASALALILTNGQKSTKADAALHAAEAEIRELKSVLDTATDGAMTLDAAGRIVGVNARAAALFARPASELAGRPFDRLLAPESERAAREHFERVVRAPNAPAAVLDVAARVGDERLVPLALTLTRIGNDRICATFRDITMRRQVEEELRNAKRETARAASAKAEFLAKVSHEIRTPLNAMTGFAEVIMAERFGPIGNERYREYVKDIHNAGTQLVAILNDLLDLSKIETGQIDLNFANVNLNDLTQQCVGIMQPQANRARIIIRTSLTPGVPLIVADERSLRQIVLNLISNSIRFTGPGGQVIVSTVFSDSREAVLRVRDTGAGMSEKDIEAALQPFRQTATAASWGSGGTGFGLPLTKALAEANRANFSIKSAPNAGTLVEVAFPPNRLVAS
jgi:PAS domain S-box-containing protein